MLLPVNELFETIQGEGHHAGTPSVFVRLQGCPVGCPWCDTKYTWEVDSTRAIEPGRMLTKDHAGDASWAAVDDTGIVAQVMRARAKHVVLTGGEPAMYNLASLTKLLHAAGRTTQIETSGTYPVQVDETTWVTVSPKVNMPGGRAVLNEALMRANEIKMPVGKTDDIVTLIALLDRGVIGKEVPIYLQPLSLSRRATDLCVANAISNNWRVSLQIHALAGWR